MATLSIMLTFVCHITGAQARGEAPAQNDEANPADDVSTRTGTGQARASRAGNRNQKPGPGVIVLEAEVIKGKIHKPEAFYILQRSDLNYQSLEQEKSFIPQIIESTADDPF